MRRLVITEEFGLYRLEAEGIKVTARTPEKVVLAAFKVRAAGYPESPDEPDVHTTQDMGDVLETLLGASRVESEIQAA